MTERGRLSQKRMVMMRKATEQELRKSIALADALVKAGIRFVPIPVFDEVDFYEQTEELNDRMSRIILGAEANDAVV